jgi:hypothetical protein
MHTFSANKKMKYTILSIILFGVLITNSFGKNYKVGDTLNVFTESGLNLRDTSNLDSKILFLLPFGSQVEVLNTFEFRNEMEDTINGRFGNWIIVKYKDKTGYAFDGYLSGLPIPITNLDEDNCVDPWEYGINDIGNICIINYSENPSNRIEFAQLKNNHQLMRDTPWEGGGPTELILSHVRISEAINLSILISCQFGLDTKLLINNYFSNKLPEIDSYHKVIEKKDYGETYEWYELDIYIRPDKIITLIFNYSYD